MQIRWNFGLVVSIALLAIGSACDTHAGRMSITVASGGDKAQRDETLPLELASGEELRINLSYGDIAVRVADGEALHVDAHWHADGEDKAMAETVLARFKLEMKRGVGSLSMAVVGEELEVKGTFGTKRYGASVDLSLVVPSNVKLVATSSSGKLSASGALGSCKLKSSYGDVSASGVRGATTLETASGKVAVADIEAAGLEVEAKSQYGDIEARRVRADKIHLSTSSGKIKVESVDGEQSIKSNYGDLDVSDSNGELNAVTDSGNIRFNSSSKAKRKLLTSYGHINVSGASGELEATTSSGNVTLENVAGNVSTKSSYGNLKIKGCLSALSADTTSGNVEVQAVKLSEVSSPWHISSSYGNVTLTIPRADFSCQLEASASSGEVHCEALKDGDGKPRTKFSHSFNNGGGTITVGSASGDVHITLD